MRQGKEGAMTKPEEIAQDLTARLEEAWNGGDGNAYGEPFAEDADFVAIRGDLHTSRTAIGSGHQAILDTIYAGSKIRYEVIRARQLNDEVIIAHVRNTLNAPTGPLAGEHIALATVVIAATQGAWQIAALHNTLITG
jgi:uncharacterized protein (TIGR02246 family)